MNVLGMTMCSHASKRLAACCLALLVCATSSFGQGAVTLIGPSTRNGSFEDGLLAPWASGHDVQVLHDPTFASDGEFYAVLQSSLVLPVLAGQNLQPKPEDGLAFVISFDARVGVLGLDVVTPIMSARTQAGEPLSASLTLIAVPPLSASVWQNYEFQLLMPAEWDAAGVTFGFRFSSNEPLGGIAHSAYLDNVVLTQIPEPSLCALLGLGGLCLGMAAFQRRAVGRGRIELNRRQG